MRAGLNLPEMCVMHLQEVPCSVCNDFWKTF